MNIIVLHCFSRNALAVINSLDPSYRLIGGTEKTNNIFSNTIDKYFTSSRLKDFFRYTDPAQNPNQFKEDVIEKCNFYKADAVLATGTTVTNYLSKFKKDISAQANTKVLVEEYKKLNQLSDKWKIANICEKLDVPIPETFLLQEYIEKHQPDNMTFPLIIKPRDSYAAKGVTYIRSYPEMESYIATFKASKKESYTDLIVQEHVSGQLHDVTSCAKKGFVLSMLSQQRVMSLYDFGGGGIVNKTTYEPDMMEYAKRIIKYLEWNGILEFDFIRTDSGEYFLLECNPKIWGTTQLTVDAGLNMPQQLVDNFMFDIPLKTKTDYEVGIVYKWLFPECVYHWFSTPVSFTNILKRFLNTWKRYGNKKALNNINRSNLRHLLGSVLNSL